MCRYGGFMKVKNIKILMMISLGFNALYFVLLIVFILAQKIIRQVFTSGSLDGFVWPIDVLGINFARLLIAALFFYVINRQLNAKNRQRIITEVWCMIVFFLFPFFSQIASFIQTRILSMREVGSDAFQIYFLITNSLNWISVFVSAAHILLFIICTASICYKLSMSVAIPQNPTPPQSVPIIFEQRGPEADL